MEKASLSHLFPSSEHRLNNLILKCTRKFSTKSKDKSMVSIWLHLKTIVQMLVSPQLVASSTTSMPKDTQEPGIMVEHRLSTTSKIYAKKEHLNSTILTLRNGEWTFRPFQDHLPTLPFILDFWTHMTESCPSIYHTVVTWVTDSNPWVKKYLLFQNILKYSLIIWMKVQGLSITINC